MIGENIAVLDLGTNSFHLLIAKSEDHGFEELLKKKIFVQLAEHGIEHIPPQKFELGLRILEEFNNDLNEYNVSNYKVFATAGLRTAENGDEFRKEAKNRFGFNIELIDGQREAELIHKGVVQVVDLNARPRLIMDIGGGSTEFIIANKSEVFWKGSFPIGAGVLKSKFHHSEPITNQEYIKLVNFLENELSELWDKLDKYQPIGLVGASGSFNSLVNIQRSINNIYPQLESKSEIVNLSSFRVAHLKVLKSTLEERLTIDELEPERAPMMPVATTLMSVVINHLKPDRSMIVSRYALKEGMLSEMSQ